MCPLSMAARQPTPALGGLKQGPFHFISPVCGSDMWAGLPGALAGVVGRLGSAGRADRSA